MNRNNSQNSDDSSVSEITLELLRGLPLTEYSDDADKADYGKLLIIAGSRRLPGAAILAARAALRSGCGTVRVAAPESVAVAIGVAVPELMVLPLPETPQGTLSSGANSLIEEQAEPCDAVVIGPGLDSNDDTRELLRELAMSFPLPAVLDASAILAMEKLSTKFAAARILTPHLREMSTLTGTSEKGIVDQREKAAQKFASDHNCTLVLKDRETLIATADEKTYRNTAGTRGLGTAGSGDVLAGIIGGLLTQFVSQKLEPSRAAVWGVYLHALAGEAAEKELGADSITASDLVRHLPGALRCSRRQTSRQEDQRTGLRRN